MSDPFHFESCSDLLHQGEIENQIKSKLGKLGQAIAIVGKPKNLDSKQTLAVFLQVENMRDQTEEQLIPMSDVLRARLVNLESEVKRELTSYMVSLEEILLEVHK